MNNKLDFLRWISEVDIDNMMRGIWVPMEDKYRGFKLDLIDLYDWAAMRGLNGITVFSKYDWFDKVHNEFISESRGRIIDNYLLKGSQLLQVHMSVPEIPKNIKTVNNSRRIKNEWIKTVILTTIKTICPILVGIILWFGFNDFARKILECRDVLCILVLVLILYYEYVAFCWIYDT